MSILFIRSVSECYLRSSMNVTSFTAVFYVPSRPVELFLGHIDLDSRLPTAIMTAGEIRIFYEAIGMAFKVAVLLPAAGCSKRFKGKTKKQFCDINGRAVFLRTVELFADRDDVSQVVMAIPAEDDELFKIKWEASLAFHGVKVIHGGAERHETVAKMLDEVKDDVDLIALHDAVRPCVTKEQINAVFKAAAETGAAILSQPLVGTIKQVGEDHNIVKTIDRSGLWEAQTPQVFKPEIIRKAYAQRDEFQDGITDDAQLVEALGISVKIVQSTSSNIKITTNEDIAIAGAILKARPKPKPKGPTGPWAAEQGW